MIPTLETERLTMRAWRQADFEPFAQFYADPATAAFVAVTGQSTAVRPAQIARLMLGHALLSAANSDVKHQREKLAAVVRRIVVLVRTIPAVS